MTRSIRLPTFQGEAFMARHLPDLGQEVEETQVYTWSITNWRKQDKKVTSPEFDCGGHKWSAFSTAPAEHRNLADSYIGVY